MKRIVVLASALVFLGSVTVFGQTQKPAEKKDQPKTTTTAPAATPAKSATTTTQPQSANKEQKTSAVITTEQLPKAAQDYITKTYPGKKVEKASKVTEGTTITYKADVAGMILHFDANGKLLKETKKEEKPATEAKPGTTTQPAPTPAPEKKTTTTTTPAKK